MNASPFGQEPGHDEIALRAFLIWEREGRQPGRETAYWLQAECEIRTAYQKKAEQAAAVAARPWPPQPLAPSVDGIIEVKRAAAPKTVVQTVTKTLSKPRATKLAVKTASKAVVAKTLAKPASKIVTTKTPVAAKTTIKTTPVNTARLLPVVKPTVRASFAAASKPAPRAVRRTA